ncbi:MAG: hypothetical protein AAGF11_07065 [Myxococcota bacterium]
MSTQHENRINRFLERLRPLAAAALVLASCQDAPGRHIVEVHDIAIVSSDEPLCAGDLHRIEQAIGHIEDILDVSVSEPIPVYLYSRYDDVTEQCWPGVAGCYTRGEVHTLWQALEHELVHAVDSSLGAPPLFWAEGMAEALSNRTWKGQTEVDANLDLDDESELDLLTAGHFVRWLLEEHGAEGLRRIAREQPFVSAYGFELTDAIADYEITAPWSYPHWNPCRGKVLSPTGPDRWELDIEIDCAEPFSTAEYSLGAGGVRTIDIEHAGTYRLSLQGGHGINLIACQLDALPEPPASDFAGDIIREEAGLVPPSQFVSDQDHQVQLEPGRLLLYLSTDQGVTREQLGLELVRLDP